MASHASLDASANDRKARLAKLAAVKRKQQDVDEAPAGKEGDDVKSKYLSGRNYDIEADAPRLGFENNPGEAVDSIERRAKVVSDEAKVQAAKAQEDKPLDLFTLLPKKPNWDLKRDLAAKMDLLNQRTDNAIARLVRERVGAQQKKNDGEQLGMAGADLVSSVLEREREEAEEEQAEAAQEAF